MKLNLFKIALVTAFAMCVTAEGAVAKSNSSRTTQQTQKNDNKQPSNKNDKKVVTPVKKIPASPSKVVYTKPTPTVKAVRSVPASAHMVKHKGVNVYINNGRYYNLVNNRYIAVAPPVGIRVSKLPVGYSIVKFLGLSYFYYQGAYYRQNKTEYEVVAPPQDIIVSTLPEEADQITMDGKSYYLYDGYIYSIVNTPDGKAFKLTGQLDLN
ncbi:MAG: DUF6515 family protein [Rikenellaceae bacterium]